MDCMIRNLGKTFLGLMNNVWAMITGLFFTCLSHYLPIMDIVHLLIALFILDMFFGFLAARKLRGERFSVSIVWNKTIPRMLVSILLIICAFTWDKVYNQEVVQVYKIIGWYISGVLIYKIAKNGYVITKWEVFPKVQNLFKEKTGISIDEEPKSKDYEKAN